MNTPENKKSEEKSTVNSTELPNKQSVSTQEKVERFQNEEQETEDTGSWEDFEDIAGGDFKRLLGCG